MLLSLSSSSSSTSSSSSSSSPSSSLLLLLLQFQTIQKAPGKFKEMHNPHMSTPFDCPRHVMWGLFTSLIALEKGVQKINSDQV